jgi:hypothetical protein
MRPNDLNYRLLEMVPGLLVWGVLFLAIILSFVQPLWVIVFVILFDLFWLMRVLHFVFYVNLSFRNYKSAIKVDWFAKLKTLSDWEKYRHIIYLPTAGESLDVLRTTLNSFLNSKYPSDKMIVVLGGEGRMENDFLPKAEVIRKEYGDKFYRLLVTVHPDGQVGEVKGKGANANWMGHESLKLVDALGIRHENLIVSYFDSDTCVHPQYFAYLTLKYMTHPNPTRASYQPMVLYNNNIWDAPAVMRVTAFGTIFWLLTELMRPERMQTFSSHSMSFKALVDVGFWQKDIVTDDSRIFLQCFFHYDGDYVVEPMYIPVSMDTVMAETYWKGFKSLYKQQRRWAWGVEHFPYMMRNFRRNDRIPFWKKFKYIYNQLEGMFSWASAPILIFILGRLPLMAAEWRNLDSSVLVQNAPAILSWLMTFSMIGIFVSAFLSLRLLPPMPKNHPKWKYPIMIMQWIFLPVTLIVFGSIPALESQTRLMLGPKYHLGFFVTPKARSESEIKN